jgi:hypothetical protein
VGPPDEHGKLIIGSREEEGEHAMAGLALAIQLLEKKGSQVSTNSLHSFSTLTALSAAAAASSAISYLPDRPSLTSGYYYVVCMNVLAACKFCNQQM